MLRNIYRRIKRLKKQEHEQFINLSFSQEGEDLVLNRLFENKQKGFYVDVGAHHPYRFSNTYKFYLKGWQGINIDALPDSMKQFNKVRKRDINLEIPILNDCENEVTYFMFDEPALNSFNEKSALDIEAKSPYRIVKRLNIRPYKLSEILDRHLPSNIIIDFLTIDVEGMDLEVLRSNDWNKYKPRVIIAESLSTNLKEDMNSPMAGFLDEKGYSLIGKTVNSIFFKLQ